MASYSMLQLCLHCWKVWRACLTETMFALLKSSKSLFNTFYFSRNNSILMYKYTTGSGFHNIWASSLIELWIFTVWASSIIKIWIANNHALHDSMESLCISISYYLPFYNCSIKLKYAYGITISGWIWTFVHILPLVDAKWHFISFFYIV